MARSPHSKLYIPCLKYPNSLNKSCKFITQVFIVVYLPLWKMMEFVNWDHDIPNIWKMFQTTNQLLWFWSRDLPHLPSRPVPSRRLCPGCSCRGRWHGPWSFTAPIMRRSKPTYQWIGLRENLHRKPRVWPSFFWKPRVLTIIFVGGVPVNLKPSSDKKLKQSIGKWLEDRLEMGRW